MTDEDVSVNEQEETIEQTNEDMTDEQALQAKLKESIEVTVEDLGSLRKRLTVSVPKEAIDEQLDNQYDELRNDAQVPGFRKGRAPQKLLEKRFGSEVGDQVTANLVSNSYFAAIEKESIDPLGDPLVQVKVKESDKRNKEEGKEIEKLLNVDEAIKYIDLPKDGPLSYTCELEVRPTFELPKLEKIPVKKPKLDITDEHIDEEVKRMLMLRSNYRPVEDGAVEADDILVGKSKMIVDGDVLKSEDDAQLAARDQRYDGMLLEGFGEATVGKKVGDTVSIEFTVAEDDDHVEARGKKATFELVIDDIKRLETPELDDEFLSAIGFDSEKEFRDFIKERMEVEIAQQVNRVLHSQIEQYLLDNVELELPAGVSQRQTERIVARQMMDLYSRGIAESEITKQTDELRTKAAEQAKDDLKNFFVMEKIAEEREIAVSEEELNTAISDIARQRNKRFDRVRDEIISTNHLNTLYIRLRDQKILEMLLADADVTEKEVGKKKESKEKEPKAKKKTAKKKTTKKDKGEEDND